MTTACIIAAVCILVAGLFAVIVERTTERDAAREAAERAGRERDAAEVEARIATELLAQREADAMAAQLKPTVVDGFGNVRPGSPRPDLRVVQSPIPMQRRGEEWDEIVRAVEGEQP